MGSLAIILATLTIVPPRGAVLEVWADAPLDVQRFADALRAYVDEHQAEIRMATAPQASSAQAQAGPESRLSATVRQGDAGAIELQLISLASGERLAVALPRPARDVDLYRTLALKVQGLIALVESAPPRGLAQPPAAPLPIAAARDAPAIEATLHTVVFPLGGVVFPGAALRARVPLGPRLELGLQLAGLLPVSRESGGVRVSVLDIPLQLSLGVHSAPGKIQASLAAVGELALVRATPSSDKTAVATHQQFVPSLGGEASVRVRFLHHWAWTAHAGLLAVLYGPRWTVENQPSLDLSRVQATVSTGLAASWR